MKFNKEERKNFFANGGKPWNKGMRGLQVLSEETKKLISETHKRNGVGKWMLGRKLSVETRKKMSGSGSGKKMGELNPSKRPEVRAKISATLTGRKLPKEAALQKKFCQDIAYVRILEEIPELERQGFRCIPIGKVIPDIIAIKDNRVFAVEVERGSPNYGKYTDEIKNYFDDIIWILRKRVSKRKMYE